MTRARFIVTAFIASPPEHSVFSVVDRHGSGDDAKLAELPEKDAEYLAARLEQEWQKHQAALAHAVSAFESSAESAVEMALHVNRDLLELTLQDLSDAAFASARDTVRSGFLELARAMEAEVEKQSDGWDGLEWPELMPHAANQLCEALREAVAKGETLRKSEVEKLARRVIRHAVAHANGIAWDETGNMPD